MTPRAILLAAWVTGGMAWAPNALAMTCMNEQVLTKKLLELRGETIVFGASMGEHKGNIGVFLNPVAGTWTLITDDAVDPSQGDNITACIRAQGRDGSAFPPRDSGQPS